MVAMVVVVVWTVSWPQLHGSVVRAFRVTILRLLLFPSFPSPPPPSLLAPSFLLLSHSHPLRSAVRYTDIVSLLSHHLLLATNINGSRIRYIGAHCIPVLTNVDRKQII